MKKILLACLIVLLMSSVVAASPFLVCDPQQGVEYYVVTGLPSPIDGTHVLSDATGAYGFKLDLATLPVGGPYTVKAKACNTVWGCSVDSSPFVFSRPSLSSSPQTIRLVP